MNLQGAVSKSAAEDYYYTILVNILAAKEHTHTRGAFSLFLRRRWLYGGDFRAPTANGHPPPPSSFQFSRGRLPKVTPKRREGRQKFCSSSSSRRGRERTITRGREGQFETTRSQWGLIKRHMVQKETERERERDHHKMHNCILVSLLMGNKRDGERELL